MSQTATDLSRVEALRAANRKQAVRLTALGAILIFICGFILYAVAQRPTRSLTAHFSAAVGVYVGSDIRVLGIKIGQIDSIAVHVSDIEVHMSYDAAYKIPANAVAVVVPPSIVSDRYVQLAPVYRSGEVLADHADIPISRTQAPVELDDLYKQLTTLNEALGPAPGQKTGPMSNLIDATEGALKGNGQLLGETITKLSQAAKTLAGGSGDFFSTIKNLQAFSDTLNQSDAQVRHLDDQLAVVAKSLADERASLGLALKNLSAALTDINGFLKKNQDRIHTSISGLASVSGTLAQQKDALNEILAVVPTAVSNVTHAFNPTTHIFDNHGATRVNEKSNSVANPWLVRCTPAHTDGITSDCGLPGVG